MLLAAPSVIHIITTGAIAGLATTAGAALVVFWGKPREQTLAFLLAAAGGVMLAVVGLDLIPTAWHFGPISQFFSGLTAGACLMALSINFLNRTTRTHTSRRQRLKNTGVLIAMGIALHDIPEGMAIAAGHEAAQQLGAIIALAITLHNLPEGMATAAPLKMAGIRRYKIMLLSLAIASVTPIGSALGVVALSFVSGTLAFFLALAAGAMGILVFQELLPTAQEKHPNWSRLGVAVGFTFFSILSIVM
ncbi:MAG: ZIP family metal transporter [Peptococcaceae bacterium]|nr:ZIP family metal transporter [Peptococcaceae bacterium]